MDAAEGFAWGQGRVRQGLRGAVCCSGRLLEGELVVTDQNAKGVALLIGPS